MKLGLWHDGANASVPRRRALAVFGELRSKNVAAASRQISRRLLC